MKRIISVFVFLAVFSFSAFTQETNTNISNSKNSFFNGVGIFTKIQGISHIPITGNLKEASSLAMGGGIDFRRGNDVFFYGQIGVLGSLVRWLPNGYYTMSPISIFVNAGPGFYLANFTDKKLNTNSFTLAITASGVVNNLSIPSFGIELIAAYYYKAYKNFSLSISLNTGVLFSFPSEKGHDKDDIYYNPDDIYYKGTAIGISYGLSLGVVF